MLCYYTLYYIQSHFEHIHAEDERIRCDLQNELLLLRTENEYYKLDIQEKQDNWNKIKEKYDNTIYNINTKAIQNQSQMQLVLINRIETLKVGMYGKLV